MQIVKGIFTHLAIKNPNRHLKWRLGFLIMQGIKLKIDAYFTSTFLEIHSHTEIKYMCLVYRMKQHIGS